MSIEQEAGRYRLQERLSPDGDSWVAEDLEEPGTQVVIKFLPETADAIAARHLSEGFASLKRPELSLPSDQGETAEGKAYLVYPWIPGQTLREILNESGPLAFGRAGHLLRQIGEALAALHEHGTVHGAIAPEHIVVRHAHGHDVATLLHTGWFRVAGETSASPAYLSPEQLAGEMSPAADVWSVAAVAAEMLTGRRAFRYGSLAELRHLQQRGIQRGGFRQLRAKLPIRVEEELRRALAWDIAQRPTDVRILTGRLAEALGSTSALPARRLFLLALLALAAIAIGIRNCRRR